MTEQISKQATEAAPVPSLGDVLPDMDRPRATVPLYLNARAVAEVEALELVLAAALEADETSNAADQAPKIARKVQAARAAAEKSRHEFALQAISHRAWARMIAAHPPTPEQLADAPVSARPGYNIDTLPGVLVRAQLVSHTSDDAQWEAFWEELSDGQVRKLWGNANALQMGDGSLGKSPLASEILRSSGVT